jgi:membrane-bound lytic murein transglycosylase D
LQIKSHICSLIGIIAIPVLLLCACAPPYQPNGSGFSNQFGINYTNNLWDQIADSFSLPDETSTNPMVRAQIDWYMSHEKLLQSMINNARPYLYYVYQQVQKRHLPGEFALLPLVESGYNPTAGSSAGAIGLWQMMPETALSYGLKINRWYNGPLDIEASTSAALDHLVYLNKVFNHDWLLTIAAYDGGEGKVEKMIQKNIKQGKPTDFWNLNLPMETKGYVSKLLALAVIMSHPNEYPIDIPSIPAAPYFGEVSLDSQIDLTSAAKMANMDLKDLCKLNPEYPHLITAPKQNCKLLLPTDKVDEFTQALQDTPKADLTSNKSNFVIRNTVNYFNAIKNTAPDVMMLSHTVKHGETIASIASAYHLTPTQIQIWNGLKKDQKLIPGTHITIWPMKKNQRIAADLSYTVQTGDTLSSVAQHFHISVNTILRHNQLDSNELTPGQILKISSIPVRYRVIIYKLQHTDTLAIIAQNYNVSVKNLMRWNHLYNNHIHAGQKIVIYQAINQMESTIETSNVEKQNVSSSN